MQVVSVGRKDGQARETPSPLCRDLVHQTRPVRGPLGWGALGGAGLVVDDSPPLDRACAQPPWPREGLSAFNEHNFTGNTCAVLRITSLLIRRVTAVVDLSAPF